MYSMLALATLAVLAQAARVFRDLPQARRPWIILGVLLSVQLSIHFQRDRRLWIGLADGGGVDDRARSSARRNLPLAAAGARHENRLWHGSVDLGAWAVDVF